MASCWKLLKGETMRMNRTSVEEESMGRSLVMSCSSSSKSPWYGLIFMTCSAKAASVNSHVPMDPREKAKTQLHPVVHTDTGTAVAHQIIIHAVENHDKIFTFFNSNSNQDINVEGPSKNYVNQGVGGGEVSSRSKIFFQWKIIKNQILLHCVFP